MTQPNWNPLEWLAGYWPQLLGLTALSTFLYKLWCGIRKVVEPWESISSVKADLDLIKTNHLPHLQAELERVNDNLTGVRDDLRAGFEGLSRDLSIVLTRIE